MRHLKSTLAVLGAVVVLALAGNTLAQAATGQNFLLGKGNNAGAQTTLARTTAGTVLSLKGTSSTGAPLAVNGKGKVTNLNADLLDGYNSTDMRNRTYLFTRAVTQPSQSVTMDLELPSGTYQVGYSVYPVAAFADDDGINCFFVRTLKPDSDLSYFGESRSISRGGQPPAVSGTGIVQVDATHGARLKCFSTTTFLTASSQPIQVYASPTTVIGGSSNLRSQADKVQLKR